MAEKPYFEICLTDGRTDEHTPSNLPLPSYSRLRKTSQSTKTELLNGRHFEGHAAGKGAAPPPMAPQRSGDIASRCPILRSSFGPNLGQIEVMAFLVFLEVPPEGGRRAAFRSSDRRKISHPRFRYPREASQKISVQSVKKWPRNPMLKLV